MQKLPDWEPRIAAYLDACATRPFAYGAHDCCLFGAGAIEALTGHDAGKPWRGKYRTEAGAAKALKRRWFDDIDGPFTDLLGEPTAPLMAARGDIVSDGANIGVMWVGGAWFVTDDGLQMQPATGLQRCWKVG